MECCQLRLNPMVGLGGDSRLVHHARSISSSHALVAARNLDPPRLPIPKRVPPKAAHSTLSPTKHSRSLSQASFFTQDALFFNNHPDLPSPLIAHGLASQKYLHCPKSTRAFSGPFPCTTAISPLVVSPGPESQAPISAVPVLYLTPEYKALAIPLANWVAVYLCDITAAGFMETFLTCTPFTPSSPVASQLSDKIRDILFATTLQPAVVFLGLWYLTKILAAFSSQQAQGSEAADQYQAFLFDNLHIIEDADYIGALIKFFVNGLMLADKLVDDHCFSTKTWNEISGISIKDLNSLEMLSLEALEHVLGIPQTEWERWLFVLLDYHQSLAPFPDPIGSRPNSSQLVVRRAIEEIILARPSPSTSGQQTPVFIGLQDRIKAKEQQSGALDDDMDTSDVDLDADGPLRDEYIPRRIVSHRKFQSSQQSSPAHLREVVQELPQPARWSPRADPPMPRSTRSRPLSFVEDARIVTPVQPTTPIGSAFAMSPRLGSPFSTFANRRPLAAGVVSHLRRESSCRESHYNPQQNISELPLLRALWLNAQ